MPATPNETFITPSDRYDQVRWEETALRHRMLDGNWQDDLASHLVATLNIKRASNLGRLSRAINLFKSLSMQIGPVLYDRSPNISIQDADSEQDKAVAEMHDAAHVWQLAQRHALYVVGLRESLYCIEWSKSEETVKLRLVTPDTVTIETPARDPDDIEVIREARVRHVKNPEAGIMEYRAFWNVWSKKDGGSFRIEDASGVDWTAEILGEEEAAEPYPYIDSDGEPFLPFVLYHAMPTSKVWDAFEWCELVDGAFEVAILWNNYQKIMRDASWVQKYTIDLALAGVSHRPEGAATVGRVTTSPDSVLMFKSEGDTTGSTGTFEVPVDVEKYALAILQYQRTMVSTLGVHPADVEQVTGNAQSGYAIQLKRSAQRRMALAMEPQFRRGDIELMQKMAMVYNLLSPEGTPDLPVIGYSITYQPPDEAITERMERLQYSTALNQVGLLSRVDQYKQEFVNASDEDAIKAILEAAAIEAALENPMELLQAGAATVDDLVRAVMAVAGNRVLAQPGTEMNPAEGIEDDDEEEDMNTEQGEQTNG